MLAELKRVFGLKSDVPDLPCMGYVQVAGGRLLKEGAGTGRAGLVHCIVDRHFVLKKYIFGILTADLENSVHIIGEIGGSLGVGDNLIIYSRSLQEYSQNLTG